MVAPTFLLLQTVQQSISNLTQTRQHERNESTSSKVPMYSTSCCDSNISTQESLYCSVLVPRENLCCYAMYIAPVETLIPSEVVEDTSVYGTLGPVNI